MSRGIGSRIGNLSALDYWLGYGPDWQWLELIVIFATSCVKRVGDLRPAPSEQASTTQKTGVICNGTN